MHHWLTLALNKVLYALQIRKLLLFRIGIPMQILVILWPSSKLIPSMEYTRELRIRKSESAWRSELILERSVTIAANL